MPESIVVSEEVKLIAEANAMLFSDGEERMAEIQRERFREMVRRVLQPYIEEMVRREDLRRR